MLPAGYMTSGAIETVLVLLNAAYPAFTQLIPLPETSVEGRLIRAFRIRAGGGDRNGVLLVGGTHAQELINPDLLVGLAYKLCWAYDNNTGLTLGATTWSARDIRLLVDELDIFILPLLNPDGREYIRSPGGDQWWRKNRGFNADGSRGTDLNRNYDFLWQWTIGNTSSVPSSQMYKGNAPFSEPETRNVRWLLDTFPDITAFVDVHSYSEFVLHPWGDDNNQSTDPTQNFLNPAWDGLRGVRGSGYAEYIPAADATRLKNVGNKIRDAIAAVRGRTYTVKQEVEVYPTCGVSSDYTYSRFFRVGGKRKVWAYVFETNRLGPGGDQQYGFQPPYADALEVSVEVQSGLIQFMISCLCVVREVGKTLLSPEILDALSNFRDSEMMQSARGRRWVDLLEMHGEEVLIRLREDRPARQAAGKILSAGAAIVLGRDKTSPPKIERALVTQIQHFLAQLEKRASPELKKALGDVRGDLRKVAGKTARQALR